MEKYTIFFLLINVYVVFTRIFYYSGFTNLDGAAGADGDFYKFIRNKSVL